MNKTYSTGEIIDKLKPGQTAICENWSTPTREIRINSDGNIVWSDGVIFILTAAVLKAKWRLLPQHVTFEEAIQAYKEGKTVECEWSDRTYTYSQEKVSSVLWYEILDGNWSIVDGGDWD